MTEEPYRWLEAIQNRREYIEDQLRSASPVVAICGPPGILLLTIQAGTPKLFEIYDHLALGCLGHPADMEKIRQAAIDTAHVEGFTRSPQDVSSRRLANYALAPTMKSAFEQIYTAPLMVRAILTELGATTKDDHAWVLEYDGAFSSVDSDQLNKGVLIAGDALSKEKWALQTPSVTFPQSPTWDSLAQAALKILLFARASSEAETKKGWSDFPDDLPGLLSKLDGSKIEVAILDRTRLESGISFQKMKLGATGLSPL
jgi:proteasome alpha subunit